MRNPITSLGLLLCSAFWAGTAGAQFGNISLATDWVDDPLIGGGGYVRVQVVNNGDEPVCVVVLGDDSDISVTYTAPGIGPYWFSSVVSRAYWEENDGVFGTYPWFTPPDTVTDVPWDTYFAGYGQCLLWQVNQEDRAIMPGPEIAEFRYLIGEGGKRSVFGPLPYLVIGDAGTVLGSGESSISGVVPTADMSFGEVKHLFAP